MALYTCCGSFDNAFEQALHFGGKDLLLALFTPCDENEIVRAAFKKLYADTSDANIERDNGARAGGYTSVTGAIQRGKLAARQQVGNHHPAGSKDDTKRIKGDGAL